MRSRIGEGAAGAKEGSQSPRPYHREVSGPIRVLERHSAEDRWSTPTSTGGCMAFARICCTSGPTKPPRRARQRGGGVRNAGLRRRGLAGPNMVNSAGRKRGLIAAHLTFAQKKEKFTRREINNEIRSAHPFYKDSMTSNLSKSLNSLVRVKRLNPIGRDTYSLSAGERTAVGAKLARTS
jgi:hypothetical protein